MKNMYYTNMCTVRLAKEVKNKLYATSDIKYKSQTMLFF